RAHGDRQPRWRIRGHRPHARDVQWPQEARRDRGGGRQVNLLSPEWTAFLYLVAAVCFILALKGLGSPKTARRGNLIGAFGALLAMVVVFLSTELDNIAWIIGVIAVGAIIAVPASRAVKMTQMPQLVALFNGVGGGAAGLVALLELAHS